METKLCKTAKSRAAQVEDEGGELTQMPPIRLPPGPCSSSWDVSRNSKGPTEGGMDSYRPRGPRWLLFIQTV